MTRVESAAAIRLPAARLSVWSAAAGGGCAALLASALALGGGGGSAGEALAAAGGAAGTILLAAAASGVLILSLPAKDAFSASLRVLGSQVLRMVLALVLAGVMQYLLNPPAVPLWLGIVAGWFGSTAAELRLALPLIGGGGENAGRAQARSAG